jgi:predicted nucleic acid-binding protein
MFGIVPGCRYGWPKNVLHWAGIHESDLFLDDLPEKAVIPQEVEKECCRKPQAFDSLIIQKAIKERKISVRALKRKIVYQKLQRDLGLGSGEGETLAFALTQKAPIVAIDDRRGIRACKLLKLPFFTAMDIVVRMSQKQIVTKEEALRKLQALARHGRYSEEIIKRAMTTVEGEQ